MLATPSTETHSPPPSPTPMAAQRPALAPSRDSPAGSPGPALPQMPQEQRAGGALVLCDALCTRKTTIWPLPPPELSSYIRVHAEHRSQLTRETRAESPQPHLNTAKPPQRSKRSTYTRAPPVRGLSSAFL